MGVNIDHELLMIQSWNQWLAQRNFVRWFNVGSPVAEFHGDLTLTSLWIDAVGPTLEQRQIMPVVGNVASTGQNDNGPTTNAEVGPTILC